LILTNKLIDPLIENAFNEDFQQTGDLTTSCTIPADLQGRAKFLAKETGIICGLSLGKRVFELIDAKLIVDFHLADGDALNKGDMIGQVSGSMQSILKAERIVLNFMQRLSGIATMTALYVDKVKDFPVKILDTRKTTPGLRVIEKYAVQCGGGINHRMGLYDMVMIKDNHIDSCGSISLAVERCRKELMQRGLPGILIEVETRNLKEVEEAARLPIQRIMLDNMPPDQMRKAVDLIDGRVETEASGNINLDTVKSAASSGVDYVSAGALTHSVQSLDISLIIE